MTDRKLLKKWVTAYEHGERTGYVGQLRTIYLETVARLREPEPLQLEELKEETDHEIHRG